MKRQQERQNQEARSAGSEAAILEVSGGPMEKSNKYRLSGFMRIVRKAEFYNLLLNN